MYKRQLDVLVNEKAAQNQGYSLATDQDIQFLLEALWNGTKNLISVSKAGHQPRMLIWIQYQPDKYHIGELDNMIQFVHEKSDEKIRSINEGTIEINQLVQALQKRKNEILTLGYQIDDQTKLTINGCLLYTSIQLTNLVLLWGDLKNNYPGETSHFVQNVF